MRSRYVSIVLILLGLVFLMHNLDILSLRSLGEVFRVWWPLILVVVGVLGLMGRRK